MNQIDIKWYQGGKISKKFFIVAGGTGGHVFPAEQIARDLLKKDGGLTPYPKDPDDDMTGAAAGMARRYKDDKRD